MPGWGVIGERVAGAATVVFVLLAALLAGTSALGAGSHEAALPTSPSSPREERAAALLLRLHDLPLGYHLVGGSPEFPIGGISCGRIDPADPKPKLAQFINRYKPIGCLGLYFRMYEVAGEGPYPLVVGTGAIELDSPEAADAALGASRLLISHATGDELPEEVMTSPIVGDETRLLHWTHGDLFTEAEESTSWLVWRSGNAVAVVFIAGESVSANDRAAIELAQRQQKHLEAPTPYTPAERDDTEVALENPALEVPVHWLGRTFDPGAGLTRLRLADAASTTRHSLVEPRLSLLYTDRLSFDHAETVALKSWTPRQWTARLRKKGLPFEQHCASSHRLALPSGRAVIYAGLDPGWRCRETGPKVYTALIRFPGVVISAETQSVCDRCFGAAEGPYNSFRGMATIARSLEPRAQP